MPKPLVWIVPLLAALWPYLPVWAIPVTLDDALTRFWSTSPYVRAAQEQVQLAEAHLMTAGQWPNPTLAYTREQVWGANVQGSEDFLTLALDLPLSARRALLQRAAEASLQAARARQAEARATWSRRLERAYLDACQLQLKAHILAETLQTYQRLEKIVDTRVKSRESAGYDLMRLRLTKSQVENQLQQIRRQARTAQGEVAGLLGSTLEGEWQIPSFPPLPAMTDLQDLALRQRGDLVATRAEQTIAQAALDMADWQRWPDPQLLMGPKYAEQNGGHGLGYQMGLSWPLPLFQQGQAARVEASARHNAAEAREQAILQQIDSQLPHQWQRVQDSQAALVAYQRDTLTHLTQVLAVAELSYQEGESDIQALVDAAHTTLAARLQHVELLDETFQAWLQLEELVGATLLVQERNAP